MAMKPLHFRNGHLFLDLDGALWLLDTGAPTSFGSDPSLAMAGERFEMASGFMGMTPATLSEAVGLDCRGLLGTDVLGRFDFVLDVSAGTAEVATSEPACAGTALPLDDFMGIPVVTAQVRGADCPLIFDTGAQISYLQDDALRESFPAAGSVSDFYPGFGAFETDTHQVELSLGGIGFALRCGVLPGMLGMTLALAGVAGIVGNQIMVGRRVGWFPRRGVLVV